MPDVFWTVQPAPSGSGSGSVPTGNTTTPATFRDLVRQKSPGWLQGGLGEKILYTFGVHLDGFADALTGAIKARFPGLYTPESLGMIGRDRRIRRGRVEADANYAVRLQRWLDDHRHRGGPYAMLGQLHAHYAPNNFQIDLVYASGRRFRLTTSGEVMRDDAWQAVAANWATWTLYYAWPKVPSPASVLWGGGRLYGSGEVWGSTLTVEEVTDLRLIPREWGAAHAIGNLVLLTPDVSLWGYPESKTWGTHNWGSAQPVRLSVE